MTNEIYLLSLTAASIGFLHTILAPNHYLPFIAVSNSQNWTIRKTLFVVLLCGIGHVLSSVVLGSIGIAGGMAVGKLESLNEIRHDIVIWFLMIFGLLYLVWGIRNSRADSGHCCIGHDHNHVHNQIHDEIVNSKKKRSDIAVFWTLFSITIICPGHGLIPLLIYPAMESSIEGLLFVILIFSIVTVATMLTVIGLFLFGMKKLALAKFEKYTHPIAGLVIFATGVAIYIMHHYH